MPTTESSGQTHKYDLFISYRREGGDATALFLREKLTQRGLRVFLDIIDLHKGYFDEALLGCIADSRNFLVILSPGALDRCVNQTDWLRQEIAHAIKTHRNIIPVITRGFNFPAELPADIATLPRHQGVEYSHMYHAAMINSILMSVEAEREEAVAPPIVTPEPVTPIPFKSSPPTPKVLPPAPGNIVQANENQGRVLDAAMAAQIPIGKPAELMAMIRLSASGGLKGVLKLEESDARPEDVRSRPFEIEFPLDTEGRAVAAEVTLQINAPDFEPPLQKKVLRVPPKADSPTYSFLLTPKFEGELRINLELCRGDVCLVSRSMRTTGTSSDRASSTKVLVSLPIEVKAVRAASPAASFPAPQSSSEPTQTMSPPFFPASAPRTPIPVASSSGGRYAEPASSAGEESSPTASYPRAAAPPSVASAGRSAPGRGGGEATATPLAKLLGVERGDFQRTRALAFAVAWTAGLFIPRIARLLFKGHSQTLFSVLPWILSLLVGVVAILGALWFVRKLGLAGIAAGIAGTLGLLFLNAFGSVSDGGFSWFMFLRIVQVLQYAVFVWILGWIALRKDSKWQFLLLGVFIAFLLSSFFYAAAFGFQRDAGWSFLQEIEPQIDLIEAALFTGIFQFMTANRKKSR